MTKKTTILFPPDLHQRLTHLAELHGVSLGELVRRACRERYGLSSEDERLAAVREVGRLSLPVGEVEDMERESVPEADELLP